MQERVNDGPYHTEERRRVADVNAADSNGKSPLQALHDHLDERRVRLGSLATDGGIRICREEIGGQRAFTNMTENKNAALSLTLLLPLLVVVAAAFGYAVDVERCAAAGFEGSFFGQGELKSTAGLFYVAQE